MSSNCELCNFCPKIISDEIVERDLLWTSGDNK